MSETVIEAHGGTRQPPVSSATRPDLARLPAYVEPPRQVTRSEGRKNSAFMILLVALGAGVCGGVALNQLKQLPIIPKAPVELAAVVQTPPSAYPVTRDAAVPLPAAIQPARQVQVGIPPPHASRLAVTRHAVDQHNRPQPARLTRPSSGYAGSL